MDPAQIVSINLALIAIFPVSATMSPAFCLKVSASACFRLKCGTKPFSVALAVQKGISLSGYAEGITKFCIYMRKQAKVSWVLSLKVN
jgi:hypothetical protein